MVRSGPYQEVAPVDLDFDLLPLRPGHVAATLEATTVRELTEEDLKGLMKPRGTKSPAITRLRARHQGLARALAAGASNEEAAAICGYGPSRVSILLADPQFKDLVEHYRSMSAEAVVDVQRSMLGLLDEAVDEMRRR